MHQGGVEVFLAAGGEIVDVVADAGVVGTQKRPDAGGCLVVLVDGNEGDPD